MESIKKLIADFEKFNKIEIESAIKELEKIKTEKNRKHLQRLVYANLVNRFDYLIDKLLLEFSVLSGEFKKKVIDRIGEEPVYLKDIYEILLTEEPRKAVIFRMENVVRSKFLVLRHSEKLRILLKFCFGWTDSDWQRPRVFVNNGSLFGDIARQESGKIPDTVIGYADWLYSRRNTCVHNASMQFLKTDIDYIDKKFNVELSNKFISIKINSIRSASTFYMNLCEKMNEDILNKVKIKTL